MIRIKSVGIKNFRGIKRAAMRDFADVNILVGRNNSGKSTVMEAIYRVGYSLPNSADPLGRRLEVWMQPRVETGLYPPELWYTLDQTEAISISTEVGTSEVTGGEHLILNVIQRGNNTNTPLDWNWSGQGGTGRASIEEFMTRASVFRPEDARNTNIERTLWQKIIGPRHDKALVQSLNVIYNQNAESYTLLDGKVWFLFPTYSVPLDSQGEGNRAALRCLILLTLLRRTFFLAEEVECHQHPGSLAGFAKALCKQAKNQEVQLFLSTHSSECVRAFLAASKESGSEAKVFHMKLDGGVLDATRLDADAAWTLLDTGVDVRFLDLYG